MAYRFYCSGITLCQAKLMQLSYRYFCLTALIVHNRKRETDRSVSNFLKEPNNES